MSDHDDVLPEEVQCRSAAVEEVDVDAGTILVRAVPYDVEVALSSTLFEKFERGSLGRASTAPHRVKMHLQHDGPLIGRADRIEDRDDGLWVWSKFSSTAHAQEARALAADGTLDQVSIRFRPMKGHMRVEYRGEEVHVSHSRAHLLDVDLVSHGAYSAGAYVASVRAAHQRATDRDRIIAALRSLQA
jgi:HK97 family phage prohead protease